MQIDLIIPSKFINSTAKLVIENKLKDKVENN